MAKKDLLPFDKNYGFFLTEIKSKIRSARISAARRMNKELTKLYWDIGKIIVERQRKFGWGKSVIEKLAKDLRSGFDHTEGLSSRNLWYMRCFYLEYSTEPILQQLVAEFLSCHCACPPLFVAEATAGRVVPRSVNSRIDESMRNNLSRILFPLLVREGSPIHSLSPLGRG